MNSEIAWRHIKKTGIVTIIRRPPGDIVRIARALSAGGVDTLEITADTPHVLTMIETVRTHVPTMLVGMGTVLDAETARIGFMHGAQFVVTPALCSKTIALARRYDKLIIPGVFTPTEIARAWEYGATAAKLFPAECVGPGYIRHVSGPFPHIPLLATGGITINNAADYINCGAAALGLGSALLPRAAILKDDYEAVTAAAIKACRVVRQARHDSEVR